MRKWLDLFPCPGRVLRPQSTWTEGGLQGALHLLGLHGERRIESLGWEAYEACKYATTFTGHSRERTVGSMQHGVKVPLHMAGSLIEVPHQLVWHGDRTHGASMNDGVSLSLGRGRKQ